MTTPQLVCAAVTLISAVVSFAYSFLAVRGATGEARTLALYAIARSTALLVVSGAAWFVGPSGWLAAAAVAMIIVQAADALVGATTGDRLKTIGPAATALVNLVALLWMLWS